VNATSGTASTVLLFGDPPAIPISTVANRPMIESFLPAYSQGAVEELRRRLRQTRWTETVSVASAPLGVDRDFLVDLCNYWMNGFDWESQLNGFAALHHYRYQAREGYVHFIHERGRVHLRCR
jgi:hypothetical protein